MAYPGGKNGAGVYQAIINQMPPHLVYIEPFIGGGAIFRHKRPASINIGADLDAAVIHGHREFFRRYDLVGSSKVADHAGVGRYREKGRMLRGGLEGDPSIFILDQGLPKFEFFEKDGISLLRNWVSETHRTLIYCDPPYLLSTRTGGKMYTHEMTEKQHEKLLDVLVSVPYMVMVSGYWSQLYAKKLRGWRTFEYSTVVRSGDRAREWVWCNFPEPVALHDYAFLGDNYRERERIKRKQARWVGRLHKMPLLERRSLLAAIGEAWA